MSKRNALLTLAFLCLLATLALLGLKSMGYVFSAGKHGQTAAGNTPHPSLIDNSDQPPQTKRGRHEDGDAKALRELEAEFDEILPAQFPEQFSSLCDTTLDPGETLVLGGFRKADGDYEFTMLEVEPIGPDGTPWQEGAASQYKVTLMAFGLSREKSVEMGFGSLISPAMTRIQKSMSFPPGEAPSIDAEAVATMPSVVTRPDQYATIQMGANDKAYKVSMIVSREDTGKSIRIRTRVESPDEDSPD
jgi:hypothetical protein